MKRLLIALAALAAGTLAGLYATGHLPIAASPATPDKHTTEQPPPAVTVAVAVERELNATALVVGTMVAREQILIAPEIEGYRVLEVLVEEGQMVDKGAVLARLDAEPLRAQLASNRAALARAEAAIAQAKSAIVQADARQVEAAASLERAKPLSKSGYLSESTLDQREAAARTAVAQAVSARDGLRLAEAERLQVEAQGREIAWRLERTEVRSPAAGLLTRRNARIGAVATAAGEAMFRLALDAEIELEAEVPERLLAAIRAGQSATVQVDGVGERRGTVRLVSPEVDRSTRLGHVRIGLGADPDLRVGGFARSRIVTAVSTGIAIPSSAVLYGREVPSVLVVVDGRVAARAVVPGLRDGEWVEVRSGLTAGERVVSKAGTFLRDGDPVRVVPTAERNVSQAG